MSQYKPKFTMDTRICRGEESVALWVTMPHGEKFNIWDFPKVPDERTQNAIQSAFNRGFEAARMLDTEGLRRACTSIGGEFEMEEE